MQRLGLEAYAEVLDAVLFQLARDQEPVGDDQLLFLDITGELDHFQPVEQRRRDGHECIGGGDEHDLGEVESQLQIMIGEGVILFRVEHFQQGRGRVAAEILAELVDLIQHEERVGGPGAFHGLDDSSGQRADVRAAMAADFGLIPHAAQRNAHELASQRLGDGSSQRGLAGAGRTNEAQDRLAFLLRFERAHGNIFQDALLGLLQPVMVAFQDLRGMLDIQIIFGTVRPGQVKDPIHVSADDAHFGGHGRHLVQTFQFLHGGGVRLFGQPGRLDFLLQIDQVA